MKLNLLNSPSYSNFLSSSHNLSNSEDPGVKIQPLKKHVQISRNVEIKFGDESHPILQKSEKVSSRFSQDSKSDEIDSKNLQI